MKLFRSLDEVADHHSPEQTLFIIGGGEIYSLALPLCHELFLTEVRQTVPDGDAFFPEFRHEFEPVEVLDDNPEFLLRGGLELTRSNFKVKRIKLFSIFANFYRAQNL